MSTTIMTVSLLEQLSLRRILSQTIHHKSCALDLHQACKLAISLSAADTPLRYRGEYPSANPIM